MAILDIIESVPNASFGSTVGVTFSGTPANGELILLFVAPKNQDISAAPSGFTLLGEGTFENWLHVYAKVASGEAGATYSATGAAATDWAALGIRLTGPFTDLSTLVASFAEVAGYGATQLIMDAAVSVAANTLVFAGLGLSNGSASSFSSATNSFVLEESASATATNIIVARRLYAGADSGVQTTITVSAADYGWRFLLRIAEPSVEDEPALIVDDEPSTTASGYPIDPPVVVRATTDGTTTDTSFTGNITASLVGAGGVLYGTTVVAAIAGVATFDDLVPCVAGTYVLEFTASGFTLAESANFSVTSGSGGSTLFTDDVMSRPIKDGETVAAKKRIPLKLRDSSGAPTAASMTGRKAQLSANGGSETPSTNDIVQIGSTIRGYVELTNTEAASFTAGDYVEARVDGDTGLVETVGYAEIFPDDPYANAADPSSIADEVETRTIAAVGTVNGFAANSLTATAIAASAVTKQRDGMLTWEPFTGYTLARLFRVFGTLWRGTNAGQSTTTPTFAALDASGSVVATLDTKNNRLSVSDNLSNTP